MLAIMLTCWTELRHCNCCENVGPSGDAATEDERPAALHLVDRLAHRSREPGARRQHRRRPPPGECRHRRPSARRRRALQQLLHQTEKRSAAGGASCPPSRARRICLGAPLEAPAQCKRRPPRAPEQPLASAEAPKVGECRTPWTPLSREVRTTTVNACVCGSSIATGRRDLVRPEVIACAHDPLRCGAEGTPYAACWLRPSY